jgi:hypothetical protein
MHVFTVKELKERTGHSCEGIFLPKPTSGCGCHCGNAYDENWKVIISNGERGGHVECKCIPSQLKPN